MANNEESETINFYTHSIEVSSFLNNTPSPKAKQTSSNRTLKSEIDSKSHILQIGVLGKANTGKTCLINELSRNMITKKELQSNINFNDTSSNAIYYKSIANSTTTNVLFMKSPSFNGLLPSINDVPYHQLVFNQDIMNKFVIGYFAWFSDVLIIVVDDNSVNDYEDYYYEIQSMRHSRDNIYIVHRDSESIVKVLENKEYYNKNNFNTMTNKPKSNTPLEYYYVNKRDERIIHLIYEPKTEEELISDIEKKDKEYKKNNTLVVNFLLSVIQTQIQKEKGRLVTQSYEKYYDAFISQALLNKPQSQPQSNSKSKSKTPTMANPQLVPDCFIDIDVLQKPYCPKLKYSVETINNEKVLYIDMDLQTNAQIKQVKNDVVGDVNLIKYQVTIKGTNANELPDEEGYVLAFEYSNLTDRQFEFEIRIPTNDCVILKTVKVRKEKIGNRLRFIYGCLQDEDEETITDL